MTTQTDLLPLSETVAPADQAAVAEAIRAAGRDNTPVYPIGGATSLDYGGFPRLPGIGLLLTGLDRVVDHAAADMTVTVEAGLTVAELSRVLAAKGQRLPIDVPRATTATVGGLVATNHSGPRRYAFGTMRDYVIGLRAVDGQGMAFSAGGRVVKNAAGYDLCRLLVGSLGTIGVITQVALIVRPQPEATAVIACDVPDHETAETLLAELVGTKTLPAAIELLAGPAMHDDAVIGRPADAAFAQLIVGFEASTAEVAWMVEQIQRSWRRRGIDAPAVAKDRDAKQVWQRLTEMPADVRIGVRPGAVVQTMAMIDRLDLGISMQAHAGDGEIRLALTPADGMGGATGLSSAVKGTVPFSLRENRDSPQHGASLLRENRDSPRLADRPSSSLLELVERRLRPAVTKLGGHVTVLANDGRLNLSARQVFGPPGDGHAVMCAIKDRFDPQNLLNPGRLDYAAR